MNYSNFRKLCSEDAKSTEYRSQSERYLCEQCVRLYRTFAICADMAKLSPIRRVLSVGAGSAYVEIQLKTALGADVTIVDFPEMVELNRGYYQRHGFKSYSADLSRGETIGIPDKYDLVMSCEVLEHLCVAPSAHIGALARNLLPEGRLLITTPNFAKLTTRVKMLLGLPVLTEPEFVFAPVNFKNEGIHRREYVEREILDAMKVNKIRHIKTCYSRNKEDYDLKEFVFDLVPPMLKPTMIIVGQNAEER